MSQRQKLLQRLANRPRDFEWNELITLMQQHGFAPTCSGGSHYMFEHACGFSFGMSRTHPSGLLKPYQVKAALEALERVGVTP